MTQQQQTINGFLVDVFNDVLRLEERSLRKERTGLSLTELHVLETVQRVSEERGGTMADVAAALGVTSGTLTIAVKTLEQKGYVRRERDDADRRRVIVRLTDQSAARAAPPRGVSPGAGHGRDRTPDRRGTARVHESARFPAQLFQHSVTGTGRRNAPHRFDFERSKRVWYAF